MIIDSRQTAERKSAAAVRWGVIKGGKGVCPSRAQQYPSNAAMANSNGSGSPDAATCLSGKRVRIRQSLRIDAYVQGHR